MARVPVLIMLAAPATGNALAGVAATVKNRATNATVTLYAAETGPTTVPNPMTTDVYGRAMAWADRAAFRIDYSGTELTSWSEYRDVGPSSDAGIDSLMLGSGLISPFVRDTFFPATSAAAARTVLGIVNVNHYGNGADGAATISSTVNLSRDMQYTTLTVNSGGVINTNGFRIFCTGALTVNSGGVIQNNGSNASSAGPGAGAPAGTYLGGGTPGCPGFLNAAPTAGLAYIHGATRDIVAASLGGSGGSGSDGSVNIRGGLVKNQISTPFSTAIVNQIGALFATQAHIWGGAGGGSAGVNGGAFGWGAGGGGVVCLVALSISNAGTIRANGGSLPAGQATTYGGGGGGGGGVILLSGTYTNTGTIQAVGGTGDNTGGAPGVGGNGVLFQALIS